VTPPLGPRRARRRRRPPGGNQPSFPLAAPPTPATLQRGFLPRIWDDHQQRDQFRPGVAVQPATRAADGTKRGRMGPGERLASEASRSCGHNARHQQAATQVSGKWARAARAGRDPAAAWRRIHRRTSAAPPGYVPASARQKRRAARCRTGRGAGSSSTTAGHRGLDEPDRTAVPTPPRRHPLRDVSIAPGPA